MIRSFDNAEDMFKEIEASREFADSRVQEWQVAVKPGDFAARHLPDLGVVVYCEFLDHAEEERKAGGTEEEVQYVVQRYAAPHMKNFRFAMHYSPLVSEGELGDVHVATLFRTLTKAEFEMARARGWPLLLAAAEQTQ